MAFLKNNMMEIEGVDFLVLKELLSDSSKILPDVGRLWAESLREKLEEANKILDKYSEK